MSKRLYNSIQTFDATIIGAGVIGLAVARELAAAGLRVLLIERAQPGGEATRAAAGMLLPGLEFEPESPLRDLGERSLALYPELAEALLEETGLSIDLRLNGALNLQPVRESAGGENTQEGTWLSTAQLAELEPSLRSQSARWHPGQGSVDNRALARALWRSCEHRGVSLLVDTAVERVVTQGDRVTGVVAGGRVFATECAINTAGAWASEIRVDNLCARVGPVKGQMLSIDQSSLSPAQWLRHVVYSPRAYIVPRSDGRVVVGTTVEDCGFDKSVDPGTIDELLGNARDLVPPLAKCPLVETWAGLRPARLDTSDEEAGPQLGALGPSGHFVAVGHYRNGILLAPITARIIADTILAVRR